VGEDGALSIAILLLTTVVGLLVKRIKTEGASSPSKGGNGFVCKRHHELEEADQGIKERLIKLEENQGTTQSSLGEVKGAVVQVQKDVKQVLFLLINGAGGRVRGAGE